MGRKKKLLTRSRVVCALMVGPTTDGRWGGSIDTIHERVPCERHHAAEEAAMGGGESSACKHNVLEHWRIKGLQDGV